MDKYSIIRQLGKGGFATVYLVKRKEDGQLSALKVMDLAKQLNKVWEFVPPKEKEAALNRVEKELSILRRVSSPDCNINMTCYYDSWIDRERGMVYLEMEYINGLTLDQYFKRILDLEMEKEEKVELMFSAILGVIEGISSGLKYIHDRGIIHGDIKPDNIIIEDQTNIPKLVDFGVSCYTKDKSETECFDIEKCCRPSGLTWNYVAPEFVLLPGRVMFPKSDVFSLGATLFHLITGEFIWKLPKDPKGYENAITVQASSKQESLSIGNKKIDYLITGMIQNKIERRLSVDRILKTLKN